MMKYVAMGVAIVCILGAFSLALYRALSGVVVETNVAREVSTSNTVAVTDVGVMQPASQPQLQVRTRDGKQVMIRDIRRDTGVYMITPDASPLFYVIPSQNKNATYEYSFVEATSEFRVGLRLSESPLDVRNAEIELQTRLGVTKDMFCRLSVDITVQKAGSFTPLTSQLCSR